MQIYGMSGEKLGTIGKQPEDLSTKLPSWKQDFLAKPSASVRQGIAWGFHSPYEDTDTLVLTTPSGEFVDIRLPKGSSSSENDMNHPSFWAFSGKAETTFLDADGQPYATDMPYAAHCKFMHDIDSRGPGIADEGDMFLLKNGDCMEMGIMRNPVSGQDELYKEYWCGAERLPVEDVEGDSSACVVAKVVSPKDVRGIAIKLGGRVQGIVEHLTKDNQPVVGIERWICDNRSSAQQDPSVEGRPMNGSWSRDSRSNIRLPQDWLCTKSRNVGDQIEYGLVTWEISETYA